MRGKQAPKRKIKPDPKFNNISIARFINKIMKRGKKTVAQKVVYGSFEIISNKLKRDPIEVYEQALRNVSPSVEVKGRRIGGANYQIPVPVSAERRDALAMRWIIDAARAKKGKTMGEKLAAEFIDASNNEGTAVKKKEDTHRMADANRAFAHFIR